MYKILLILVLFFSLTLNASDDLFFDNNLNVEQKINDFKIKVKDNKLNIFNQNIDTWFIRIINLEKNEQLINAYLYNKLFEKEISFGTYNVYIKDVKSNKEVTFYLNYNVNNLNEINDFIIDSSNFNSIFKNLKDNSYGISFTDNNFFNFYLYDNNPVFLRLSNFGNNILNGYYYGSFNQSLEEGLYSLYIKTKYSEIEKNIYIYKNNKKVIKNLELKKVNMIRDIPFFINDQFLFQWYPIKLYNLKYKYLIQFKKGLDIKTFIVDEPFFETKELKYDYYRVFAYPSIIYSGEKSEDLINIYKINEEKSKWIKFKDGNKLNYLIGEEETVEGNISELSLYLPSGFSFANNKNEYIITSADKGEIIYVKNNKFKRYMYKDNIGMPLKLGHPIYMGNNKFIITDNSNSRIVEFDIKTTTLKTLFGDTDGKFENLKFKNILEQRSKLGEINEMYTYNKSIYLSISLKFKENMHSWYSIPKSNPMLFEISKNKLIKKNIDIFNRVKCTKFLELDKNTNIIVSSEEILNYVNNKVVWKYKINGFGAGLVFINDKKELLLGNHTELLRLDLKTGKKISLETNIKFANIVDIDKINENEFVITDSDSGSIYFTKLVGNKLELLNSISGEENISTADIIKIKQIKNKLFVLTSNPSYLYKMDLDNYKVEFLIGNGTNSYATNTDNSLNTGMYYPNDFFIDDNNIVYIPEANHRILILDKNKLSIFAGRISNGNAIGEHSCDQALFSNVKSIIKIGEDFVLTDSANDRLLLLNKVDNTCKLSEIKLKEDNEYIKFNFISYIFRVNSSNYLIEQNANRILKFNDNFELIDTIGQKRIMSYQGMGKDDDSLIVEKAKANFSTPIDLCFNQSRDIVYIADLFNGKIKNLIGGEIKTVNLINKDYVLPITCTIYDDNLYYVNGLTNKLYINKSLK